MRKLIVYEVLSSNDCTFFVIHFFHREKSVYNFTPQPKVTLAEGSAKDILDSVSEHHLAITYAYRAPQWRVHHSCNMVQYFPLQYSNLKKNCWTYESASILRAG